MSKNKSVTRRSFFQFAFVGFVGLPILLNPSKALSADKCAAVPPKGKMVAKAGEGMAKTLQYVEDAKTSKNAKYKAGAHCGNCKFYNVAKEEGFYAPCTMLGMKYVTTCGWCISYIVKA